MSFNTDTPMHNGEDQIVSPSDHRSRHPFIPQYDYRLFYHLHRRSEASHKGLRRRRAERVLTFSASRTCSERMPTAIPTQKTLRCEYQYKYEITVQYQHILDVTSFRIH